jgi:signal transduction histidine kinase
MKIISETTRPASVRVILLDEKGEFYDEYSFGSINKINSTRALPYLEHQNKANLILDEYISSSATDQETGKLVDYLRKHDISISLKLFTRDEVVGYVLLGPKLSGNTYSSQDIRFMGIGTNELSVALQNARRYDQIKRFNETLRLEIERATAELVKSNEKLRELDEAKDEFVTMASHQLRTPLTSVKGYLSMVMEGDAGKVSGKQRELLNNAFTSSQRMVYLIADLLNVSRLKTGKFIIDTSEVNLSSMIEGEVDQLKESAKARELKLEFKAPKKFPNVMLDENKTRQVIMNFIDNAIYYTPAGGKINIELKATAKQVELTVNDNGIGVPKSERHNLFNKFYRAVNARKARPDGTGLGLFMAKKVIIAQGGAIIFDSKEGKGSTFGFSFPLNRVAVKTKKSASKSKKPKSKK